MPGFPDLRVALAVVALLASGCSPSCAALCRKLDRCGLTAGVTPSECEVSCDAEQDVVADSDAVEDRQAFADHRACIGAASCDELAAGDCFDDALYPFSRAD